MKHATTILAILALGFGSVHAQTVPLFINYQGKVTDSNGIGIGTGTPVNRKVIFRIWNHPSNTTGRLWTEEQTVTIYNGEFSVLLGQGIDPTGTASAETHGALDLVFTSGGVVAPSGPLRYLEITVDNGDNVINATDVAITPRQQITTTAYSFRSKVADTVAGSSIDVNALAANSVTTAKLADNSINNFKIVDGAVNNAKIADASINSAKIQDLSVGTADLADNSVITSKISDNAVTSAKISDGGVATADLADNSITTAKIAAGAVASTDLAANSIDSSKIADGTITSADLANSAVTLAKLDGSSIGLWTASGTSAYRASGNVGIGTTTPGFPLNFASVIGDKISLYGATGSHYGLGVQNGLLQIHTDGSSADIAFGYGQSSSMTETMRIKGNGYVGIGTSTPVVPLDVNGLSTITMTDNGYDSDARTSNGTTWTSTGIANQSGVRRGIETYGMSGGKDVSELNVVMPVGIRSQGWIASARGIVVYSDRRIKRDLHASESKHDLAAIQKLQVTDYRMVDPADGGMAWHKGFIAQEVEKVIPGAVTRSVEFVPDIFSQAIATAYNPAAKTLSLTLGKDHELKVGESVRLHLDGKRLDLQVSEVTSAREFVVENCESAPEKVLVYGRQVKDFRTVDYDRIFTTSVGALQELKKEKDAEVNALREENAALRDRLSLLEQDGEVRDAKLEAIHKMVLSIEKPATRTVSLKVGR